MVRYGYAGMRRSGADNSSLEAEDELLVNGESITKRLSGYSQLTVSGRGLVPYEVESVNYLNRSGARPISYRTGTKDITIKYRIMATSSEDLRGKYDRLLEMLIGGLTIGFKDDENYVYKDVYLTGADINEETSNNILSTFTLTAYDPYRYSKEKTTSEKVVIATEYVPVDSIQITFAETIERPRVRIMNGVYNTDFRLVGKVLSGTTVKITVNPQNGRISVTGADIELSTLPRELVVYNGARGQVVGSSSSKVTFTWRERRR